MSYGMISPSRSRRTSSSSARARCLSRAYIPAMASAVPAANNSMASSMLRTLRVAYTLGGGKD